MVPRVLNAPGCRARPDGPDVVTPARRLQHIHRNRATRPEERRGFWISGVHRPPMMVHRRAMKAHRRAMTAHRRAMKAHQRAMMAHRRAMMAHRRAMRVHRRPMKVHQRAMTVHRRPPTALASADRPLFTAEHAEIAEASQERRRPKGQSPKPPPPRPGGEVAESSRPEGVRGSTPRPPGAFRCVNAKATKTAKERQFTTEAQSPQRQGKTPRPRVP
jgi:hypothetical protein